MTAKHFDYIGTRPIRHDGVDKVTGRAKYTADYQLPGMIYGKILGSPFAHGRITRINVDKARARQGASSQELRGSRQRAGAPSFVSVCLVGPASAGPTTMLRYRGGA